MDDLDDGQARLAAKEHIDLIRREMTGGSNWVTVRLERTLTLLSKGLYQESTHFLFEIIQNVDDCSYKDGTGIMDISFKDGCLRIDYNEVGFSPKDVEALCDVANSSKAGSAGQFTGEKGIGFKAVFRVADVVTIFSRHYSFQFRSKDRLGMITPIWVEDFPGGIRPGYTSLILEVVPSYQTEVLGKIKSFDSAWLAFLRRLRGVTLKIEYDDGTFWTSTHTRRDDESLGCFHRVMTLANDTHAKTYVVTKFKVDIDVQEEKRAGCKQTEVLLAFPATPDMEEPMLSEDKSEHVFAYLPIRDSGCKFLIQADLLLVANRGDIDQHSDWNKKIRDAIPEAFLSSVQQFNKSPPLRYTWPRYLPSGASVVFFGGLRTVSRTLKYRSPVLESEDGRMVTPYELRFVPKIYRDQSNAPMTLCNGTKGKYLSRNYALDDREYMKDMVSDLSPREFLEDLRKFINDPDSGFSRKAEAWHSHLANILLTLSSDHHSTISELPLIPLRDGSWACAKDMDGNIFFPGGESVPAIPKGISALEVHPEVQDPSRLGLFSSLSVKAFSASAIHDLIVSRHKSTESQNPLTATALISHAQFLYHTRWTNPEDVELWVVTESGQPRIAPKTYLDEHGRFSATYFFRDNRDKFPFLHADYTEGVNKPPDKWKSWLQRELLVLTTPMLTEYSDSDRSFGLSPEFHFIINTFPSEEFLLLLRANWSSYSIWVLPDQIQSRGSKKAPLEAQEASGESSVDESRQAIRAALSSVMVTCHDHTKRRLDNTFLPPYGLSPVLLETLPILSIPEGGDRAWSFLKTLGVTVDDHINIYLRCLESLANRPSATMDEVFSLYTYIQQRCKDDPDLIRSTFARTTSNLIYVPNSIAGQCDRWVSTNECVWEGFDCLRRIVSLERIYPSFRSLFVEILNIKNADLTTLTAEARGISSSSSLNDIIDLFLEISKGLRRGATTSEWNAVESLSSCQIFPVEEGNMIVDDPDNGLWRSAASFDQLGSAIPTSEWYIADRVYLQASFRGKVPLLAIPYSRTEDIHSLIKALKLENRLLSRAAKDEALKKGDADIHFQHTNYFRARAHILPRLIPNFNKKPEELRTKTIELLQGTRVYTVGQIVVRWTVESLHPEKRGKIFGRDDEGRSAIVVQSTDRNALDIYIPYRTNSSFPPFDLTKQVQRYLAIPNFDLLQFILTQTNPNYIEATLDREGIDRLRDWGNDDQTIRQKRRAKQPVQSSNLDGRVPDEDTQPPSAATLRPQRPLNNIEDIFWGSTHTDDAKSEAAAERKQHPGLLTPTTYTSSSGIADYVPLSRYSEVQPTSSYRGFQPVSASSPQTGQLVAKTKARVKSFPDLQSTAPVPQIVGPLTVIFVPSPSGLPSVDVSNANHKILPSRFRLSRAGDRDAAECTVYAAVEPMVERDQDTTFVAELFVSRLLERHLGHHYNPDVHWTSPTRALAGHTAFQPPENVTATFTIPNCPALTAFLIMLAYKPAESWKIAEHHPKYHIEVQPTLEEETSRFSLSAGKLELMRQYRISQNPIKPPDVFMLVRVFNMIRTPGASFHVDPWSLFSSGKIQAQLQADYSMTTGTALPQARFEEFKWLGDRNELRERLRRFKELEVAKDADHAKRDRKGQRNEETTETKVNDPNHAPLKVHLPARLTKLRVDETYETVDSEKLKLAAETDYTAVLGKDERARLNRTGEEDQRNEEGEVADVETQNEPTKNDTNRISPKVDHPVSVTEPRLFDAPDAVDSETMEPVSETVGTAVEDGHGFRAAARRYIKSLLRHLVPHQPPFNSSGISQHSQAELDKPALPNLARVSTFSLQSMPRQPQPPNELPTSEVESKQQRPHPIIKPEPEDPLSRPPSPMHPPSLRGSPRRSVDGASLAGSEPERPPNPESSPQRTASLRGRPTSSIPQAPLVESEPQESADLTLLPQRCRASSGSLAQSESHLSLAIDVADDAQTYKYQDLGDGPRMIRLLELEPGAEGTQLRGVLCHVSLDSPPVYYAISYVWGFDLKLYTIQTPDKEIVSITPSLYSALTRVRQKDTAITVWADAVCIDQKNNDEKAHQIGLVPEIYKSAEMVYVWLGEESDRSGDVMKKLVQIAATDRAPPQETSHGQAATWSKSRRIPDFDAPLWHYINKFLSRRWFRRVWIVQELVLAQEALFLCGKEEPVRWEDLHTAAKVCVEEAANLTTGLMKETLQNAVALLSLGELREKWHGPEAEEIQGGFPLLELFESFQHTQSTKRRDKLFGFLGLANDSNGPGLLPNYADKLEEVVRRYASVFVERGQALDLLYRAGDPRSTRFPSWIPDWTTTTGAKTISTWPTGERGFTACRGADIPLSSKPYVLPEDNRVLVVQGHICDAIKTIGTDLFRASDAILYLKEIFKAVKALLPNNYPGAEPELLSDVIWKVPIGDASRTVTGTWKDVDFRASYDALVRYLALEDHPGNWKAEVDRIRAAAEIKQYLFEPEQLRSQLWPYLDTALEFAERFDHAVVCTTQSGYVGLVPGRAREGDVVALVEGSAVPFVLRRSAEGWFRLVGECYVHGIMKGELISTLGPAEDLTLY